MVKVAANGKMVVREVGKVRMRGEVVRVKVARVRVVAMVRDGVLMGG